MSNAFPDALAHAIAHRDVLPEFDGEHSLDEAYLLQRQVVELRARGAIGGIKAGVTAPALQGFFGVDHALLGRLYADSRLASGCTIPYLAGRNLECEFAVVVDGQGRPRAVAPAIEIVLLQFARVGRSTPLERV